MTMSAPPTGTVWPSSAARLCTVPANGLGSSTIDLAVSTSHSTSLIFTVSPGLTSHETTSASVSPSPGSGMVYVFTVSPGLLTMTELSMQVIGRRRRGCGRRREDDSTPPGTAGRGSSDW